MECICREVATDGTRHGRGMYVWSCGDTYKGEWKNGKMHGQGVFRWANGDDYVGQWRMGKMHGYATDEHLWLSNHSGCNREGTKTMANGDKYYGVWQWLGSLCVCDVLTGLARRQGLGSRRQGVCLRRPT